MGSLSTEVVGQIGEENPCVIEGIVFVLSKIVSNSGNLVVGECSAQLLHPDIFTGHGLDDVRARDEHLAGLVDHDHEVCEGRGVDGSTCSGPADNGNLGDDTRSFGVSLEDLSIFTEGDHTFLDSSSARIQDSDNGNLCF